MKVTIFVALVTLFGAQKFKYSVDGGGDTFSQACSQHAQFVRDETQAFLMNLEEFQRSCNASLQAFAANNRDMSSTQFDNELYDIYNGCVNDEGDMFKRYYNDLVYALTGDEEVHTGESILNYLTESVNIFEYPFTCINADLTMVIAVVAQYDKELNEIANELRENN